MVIVRLIENGVSRDICVLSDNIRIPNKGEGFMYKGEYYKVIDIITYYDGERIDNNDVYYIIVIG